MRRPRRALAGICIAVILLSAFLPGPGSLDCAWLELHWMLFPDEVLVAACIPIVQCDEQPVPLLSFASQRPPPSRSIA